jgi:sec-independent protein translocase protein TatC
VGIATMLSVPFAGQILKILKLPAAGAIEKLAFFGPEEAFGIYMRVSFLAGFAVAFPVLLYEFWAFLAPAVEDRFKGYARRFVIFSSAAFAAGALFAYFILLPAALKFLLSLGSKELEPVISAARYVSFITGMILCCGLVFQLPVVSYLLARMGLIDARFLKAKFKYAIVIAFVLAAVITPTTDVFNMLMLALPMLFLYWVSIWVAVFAGKRRQRPG